MRLKIIQFNYNHLGGSTTIHIEHQEELSAFMRPSYLGVHCGYHVVSDAPHELPENHIAVPIPGSPNAWLNLAILWSQPVNWPENVGMPSLNEYKVQSARLIANMIANATLSDLAAQLPTVII